ncbi:MAG: DEAD/DEAH box helicase [Armatimonadetes bacterium]|nr:DEAD/DEAH box helicase [Armatimonadota bacterium]
MLFSATMPREIAELASGYLRNAARVEVASQGTASELVDQELIYVDLNGKRTALAELLYASTGSVLVFSRTRHGARKLARDIRLDGFNAAEIHSDRSLPQRRAALEGFKNGTFKVLVATDIAARGIDVKDISLVINFDLPDQPEDYVHRIGRTGRAGAKGRAVTLAFADQSRDVRDIEVLLGTTIRISEMSSVQPKAVSFRAPLRKSVKKAVNERRDNHPRPERPASPRPHPQTPKPAAAHPNQHPPRPPQPKSPSSGAPGKASNSKPMSFFAQKKARQAATGGPRQDNRVQKPNSRRGGR